MNVQRKIQFSPPDLSELEIAYVVEAMKSGWITTGPKTKELEKKIAHWIFAGKVETVPRCVCLNSATAALELALRVLGIGAQEGGSSEDEVIVCAYTYTASASVVAHIGAKLVLVDCSMTPGSIEMDYDQLEKKITEHTKVVIPVDLAGIPCDYERIYEIINRKRDCFKPDNKIQKAIGRIAVLADAAHAFGTSYKEKMVGAIADFTSYSFHAVKNFTVAEGGAIMWNKIDGISDEEIYHQFQLYSLHGQSKDALAKTKLGAWEYDIVGPWYKCNMTDIMAAIGLGQFERYLKMLERRKKIIEMYDKAFRCQGVEVLEHYTDDYCSSGHLYITRIPNAGRQEANEIIIKMAERGVATNVHYKPLPLHTAYKKLGFDITDYPNSLARFSNEITLPLHTCLSDQDIEYVIEQYSEVVKEYIS